MMKLALPQIKKRDCVFASQTWSLFFYPEFETSVFQENGNLRPSAQKVLLGYTQEKACQNFKDFRQQVVWQATPLLMGVFYEERQIRFYSLRLSRELFLLEHLEAQEEVFKEILTSQNFREFKEHTEKMALLSPQASPSQYQLITLKGGLPDLLNDPKYLEIEEEMNQLLKKLLGHLRRYQSSWFEWISDWGLNATAHIALLRIHLLKFLAILPSLDHDHRGCEVKKILLESLRRLLTDNKKVEKFNRKLEHSQGNSPLSFQFKLLAYILFGVSRFCPAGILAKGVRFGVRFIAKRFIAGESIDKITENFTELFSSNRDMTLDQLGEWVVSRKEADLYCEKILLLIRGLKQYIPKGEKNGAGLNRAHISIKVSALCHDFRAYDEEYTYGQVAPRLKKILCEARAYDVFINIDAEHFSHRDLIFKIYGRVLLETQELADYDQTGVVLQAYLRDAYQHFLDIVELAKKRKLCLPIRLVKGAYWDAETVEAEAHHFCSPEFLNKEETDLHFRQLIVCLFENHPHVQLCLASHNYADHCFAQALKQKYYSHLPNIEHQCLHRTYEALSRGLAQMNWPTRNYIPIGSLLVGISYLVRRIMENSSQVGILTLMRSHKKKRDLRSPMDIHKIRLREGTLVYDSTQVRLSSEFFNVPPVRFYQGKQWQAVREALKKFETENLGKHYSNSFEFEQGEGRKIYCSSDPQKLVGQITFAQTCQEVQKACSMSEQAYLKGDWARAFWLVRSSVALKAADLFLVRRKELASLIVFEAGKKIEEAYADVDEAIDFLNFYAREEAKLHRFDQPPMSRGPMAAITPWNFPLAIPTGMVTAPLIAGNTVILKSAEQTPLVAQKLVDLFHEAGVPKEVLIHLPGQGENVGAALVQSSQVAGVVFTGSKEVGHLIFKKCQNRFYTNKLFHQNFPVKVIAEMGGKNAVIVTANAELDETVVGILDSAFGHAGQKCSALSRLIVSNSIKEKLIDRLKESCKDIEVCESFHSSCTINPVISREDWKRLRKQVASAVEEAKSCGGRVIINRSLEELPGYCLGPTVIELPFKQALRAESWARRELFGPVLHLIGFDRQEDAIRLFNETEYALTGGIFSQSQDDIDYYTQRMKVGNIYVNRSITGARVAIEPFGGFKMSGTGPKAGSRAYLPSFHLSNSKAFISIDPKLYREQAGQEENFDLVQRSHLKKYQRRFLLNRLTELLLQHFESLFEGIHGQDKILLRQFDKWLHNQFLDFISKQHLHKQIPGQQNYSDYSFCGEFLVVLSVGPCPSPATLMRVLCALGMGLGVTVLPYSQKSYTWWRRLEVFLEQIEWKPLPLGVYWASERKIKNILEQSQLDFVIADGPSEFIQKIGSLLAAKKGGEKMTRLLSDGDTPLQNDFKRFFLEFIWERSFAVNTMRHGAVLDWS